MPSLKTAGDALTGPRSRSRCCKSLLHAITSEFRDTSWRHKIASWVSYFGTNAGNFLAALAIITIAAGYNAPLPVAVPKYDLSQPAKTVGNGEAGAGAYGLPAPYYCGLDCGGLRFVCAELLKVLVDSVAPNIR